MECSAAAPKQSAMDSTPAKAEQAKRISTHCEAETKKWSKELEFLEKVLTAQRFGWGGCLLISYDLDLS